MLVGTEWCPPVPPRSVAAPAGRGFPSVPMRNSNGSTHGGQCRCLPCRPRRHVQRRHAAESLVSPHYMSKMYTWIYWAGWVILSKENIQHHLFISILTIQLARVEFIHPKLQFSIFRFIVIVKVWSETGYQVCSVGLWLWRQSGSWAQIVANSVNFIYHYGSVGLSPAPLMVFSY